MFPNAPVIAAVSSEAIAYFQCFTGRRLVPIPHDWHELP
jgi:hypothetical protein